MRLEGKVALISGAANGMGADEARLFAAEGAHVVLGDILEEQGKKLEAEIGESGAQALFVRLDVTVESDWVSAGGAAISSFGKVDVLVNNAGISGSVHADLLSVDTYDRVMGVNARGVFLGMKYALGVMDKNGSGSIVNISSISGIVGQTYTHMGYNASKGAVRIMTKSAAIQYAEKGIRVNSVHPGILPAMREATVTAAATTREVMVKDVPMNRVGLVEEVANAVLFLASDEASYISGVELPVDGGLTAK